MNYGLVPVEGSPPTTFVEPVEIQDVKDALRIDASDHNFYLDWILVKAAREYCEKIQGRALVRRTWELTLDRFPSSRLLEIPLRPLVSVGSVTYLDTSGNLQTLASTYTVDTRSFRPRIVLNPTESWPSTETNRANTVTVQFVAGELPEDVPTHIKQAILLLVGHWYDHPETVGEASEEVEFAVTALLNQERAIPI